MRDIGVEQSNVKYPHHSEQTQAAVTRQELATVANAIYEAVK